MINYTFVQDRVVYHALGLYFWFIYNITFIDFLTMILYYVIIAGIKLQGGVNYG